MNSQSNHVSSNNKKQNGLAGIFIQAILLLVLLSALYFVSSYFREHIDVNILLNFVKRAGLLAPLLYCAIYLIGPTIFLPASALTMAGGIMFGPFWGTIYTICSATLGATVPFLITRRFGRKPLEKLLVKHENFDNQFRKFEADVAEQGWKYVAFTRLVTLFPFLVLNYAFGLTKIPLWTYMWASFVFMLPGSFMFTYMGYAGREALAGKEGIMTKISIAVGCFILLSAIPKLLQRMKNNKKGKQ